MMAVVVVQVVVDIYLAEQLRPAGVGAQLR